MATLHGLAARSGSAGAGTARLHGTSNGAASGDPAVTWHVAGSTLDVCL